MKFMSKIRHITKITKMGSQRTIATQKYVLETCGAKRVNCLTHPRVAAARPGTAGTQFFGPARHVFFWPGTAWRHGPEKRRVFFNKNTAKSKQLKIFLIKT